MRCVLWCHALYWRALCLCRDRRAQSSFYTATVRRSEANMYTLCGPNGAHILDPDAALSGNRGYNCVCDDHRFGSPATYSRPAYHGVGMVHGVQRKALIRPLCEPYRAGQRSEENNLNVVVEGGGLFGLSQHGPPPTHPPPRGYRKFQIAENWG